MASWLSELQTLVVAASAGRSSFPVTFGLDHVATTGETLDALRAVQAVEPRVAVIEHFVDYSAPEPRSQFTVKLGMPDANPPPFLEAWPAPLPFAGR